jgi:heme/copper-type cytochrome/quinol oxidase subunit 4
MSTTINHSQPPVPAGVRYGRWAGHALGSALICIGAISALNGLEGFFEPVKTVFFILYGVVLNIPFTRIPEAHWKWSFGALIFLSIAFVFIMIASVMFGYMAAADRGERLGVPGFEGTLIFFALMQVPVVLFQRKPDLID